jgi:branched-chain amino acid aminotransferase
MGYAVSIGDRLGHPEEVTLRVTDNGFVFGDSAYETLRTYGGRVFELDRHLRRLRASIARLGFELKDSDALISSRIDAALRFAGNEESYLRLIVSRGVGDMSYRFEKIPGPTVAIYVKPLDPPNEQHEKAGANAAIVSIRRNPREALDPAIKASNLLNNALAAREAYAKGAFEAFLLNIRGEVAEGAGSNIFAVRNGVLVTPPLSCGLLEGITRAIVLELARGAATSGGPECHEEPLMPEALLSADEVFITSTLKEVLPIVRIDDRTVGSGTPGPVTLDLRARYRERALVHVGAAGAVR